MTKHSGRATINQGPGPKPARNKGDAIIDNAREQGENPSPDREVGETSPADDCTAHDRAG